MWLLNVKSKLLEFFNNESTKTYAILSHTWQDEEVLFKDIGQPGIEERQGYRKIVLACRQAESDGFEYIWIDTCCINKDSSAELSEAINSMYRWYADAAVCYAYISDVSDRYQGQFNKLQPPLERGRIEFTDVSAYRDSAGPYLMLVYHALLQCRWFTRGWTLQELVAPKSIIFFTQDWELIGFKAILAPELSAISQIDTMVLKDQQLLASVPIARIMSWAANRMTTRIEDQAYCLMGLFDVNIPMMYGEGCKAFLRLQEEIIKSSTDQSILAWQPWIPFAQQNLILAPAPYGFRATKQIRTMMDWSAGDNSFSLSNSGLRITLPVLEDMPSTIKTENICYAALNCTGRSPGSQQRGPIVLRLRKIPRPGPHHLYHLPGLPTMRYDREAVVYEAVRLDESLVRPDLIWNKATWKSLIITRTRTATRYRSSANVIALPSRPGAPAPPLWASNDAG